MKPKYRMTERVTVLPAMLTGRITKQFILNGEQAYIVDLDDQKQTETGTYCARESELK